jgi:hypothetical protein
MTKKQPPPEKPRPKTDDADQALAEASALLGFGGDLSKLCGADRVRVGMVAGLTAAVDAATEGLLAGNSTPGDIGRLTSSVDALVRLLPKAVTEAPSQLTEHQRREAAIAPVIAFVRRLHEQIATLSEENVQLRVQLRTALASAPAPGAAPVEAAPAAPADNVVALKPAAAPAPAAPGASYDYNANQDWKSYVNSDGTIRSTPRGGGHDWGPV